MFRSLWNPPEITGKCYPRMQAFGFGVFLLQQP